MNSWTSCWDRDWWEVVVVVVGRRESDVGVRRGRGRGGGPIDVRLVVDVRDVMGVGGMGEAIWGVAEGTFVGGGVVEGGGLSGFEVEGGSLPGVGDGGIDVEVDML